MPFVRAIRLIVMLATLLAVAHMPASALQAQCRDATRGKGCFIRHSRLFVITVGINEYLGNTQLSLNYGVSDAQRFARRMEQERALRDSLLARFPLNRRPTEAEQSVFLTQIDTTRVTLLVGTDATRARVAEAFATVIKEANPNDIVFFHFSGISTLVRDSARGGKDTFLCTVDARRCGLGESSSADREALERTAISTRQLKFWLENIRANRQVVVLDSDARDFFPEFVSTLTDTNAIAQPIHRDRIIIAAASFAVESGEVGGGLLTHLMVTSPHALTELFVPSRRRLFQADVLKEIDRLRAQPGGLKDVDEDEYVTVYSEREFLSTLRYVRAQTEGAPGASRGIVASGDAARPTGADRQPRRYALLIATDTYAPGSGWPALANPIHDARTIAAELREGFGYQTMVLENPSRQAIRDSIFSLAERTDSTKDEVIIFFAGHGFYDERQGTGGLATSDSRPLALDRYGDSYLLFANLEGLIDNLTAKHVLLVIDACFSGTFSGSASRSGDDPIYARATVSQLVARKAGLNTRLYLASAGKTYTPDGRPGAHSPFARRLIATLRERGGADGVLTFSKLRAALESVKPEPRGGEFGRRSDPGADFLLVPR